MSIATPRAFTSSVLRDAPHSGSNRVLESSARLWFVTALVGQWIFLYYMAAFYDAATMRGDFAAWSKNPNLLKGYVPGDTLGNLAFAAHVLLAAIVTFGGAVQLIPQIRKRFISVHRWNGRLFLVTAIAAAISGLAMIWIRGSRQNLTSGLAASIDALLIIAFAIEAWRTARVRNIIDHRRWALRTYIVANGVWFQRVGIFGWWVFNKAPIGMTKHFDGWFDLSWAFGCYLLPLAVLEIYLRVKDNAGPRGRYAMAIGLFFFTVMMGFGIYAAYTSVWWPFLWKIGA
jgi:uncharacterized membrane protein